MVNRSIYSLAPIFRRPLEAWLAEADNVLDSHDETRGHSVDLHITEARRDLERQRYLYAQGRERPYLDADIVTWTLESNHRWGLAADLAMIRRTDPPKTIWETSSWSWLYRVCPPEEFGLRHLGRIGDWTHLEYWFADEAIKEAKLLGLTQT